jgi:hypothetical protein
MSPRPEYTDTISALTRKYNASKLAASYDLYPRKLIRIKTKTQKDSIQDTVVGSSLPNKPFSTKPSSNPSGLMASNSGAQYSHQTSRY